MASSRSVRVTRFAMAYQNEFPSTESTGSFQKLKGRKGSTQKSPRPRQRAKADHTWPRVVCGRRALCGQIHLYKLIALSTHRHIPNTCISLFSVPSTILRMRLRHASQSHVPTMYLNRQRPQICERSPTPGPNLVGWRAWREK
eukprot:scaffold10405_cov93-Phaeocystis_antarctica.AAC.3